ncbi:hypothetical protein [Borreliella burgdorferi]|uniref:hypothetical protein n=1 Tax=Borreliella burgdorferi TaxID=139 RepID=UPI003DA271BD
MQQWLYIYALLNKILKDIKDGIDLTNRDDIRDKIGDPTYDLYQEMTDNFDDDLEDGRNLIKLL